MSDIKIDDQLEDGSLAVQNDLEGIHHFNVKNISLNVLAIIAVVFALNVAQSFFITLCLGIFLALSLNPIVRVLISFRIPRSIAAIIVIFLMLLITIISVIGLKGQTETLINQLPNVTKKIKSFAFIKGNSSFTTVQKMELVAKQVQTVTNSEAVKSNDKLLTHVIVQEEPFKLKNLLWKGSIGFAGAIGEFATVVFLAYFLLISGDMFKRKLVKLSGPTISRKKITINILQDINLSIQKYLFMLVITNILVGISIWAAMSLMGLENAGAWGLAAGLVHFIPYFGSFIISSALFAAALYQFSSFSMAITIAIISMLIATVIGVFITTWMTGRIAKMNSVAVFVALIFFTWLWGIWGMLLGVPIVVIIKVVAEHIEQFSPLAELLGE